VLGGSVLLILSRDGVAGFKLGELVDGTRGLEDEILGCCSASMEGSAMVGGCVGSVGPTLSTALIWFLSLVGTVAFPSKE